MSDYTDLMARYERDCQKRAEIQAAKAKEQADSDARIVREIAEGTALNPDYLRVICREILRLKKETWRDDNY